MKKIGVELKELNYGDMIFIKEKIDEYIGYFNRIENDNGNSFIFFYISHLNPKITDKLDYLNYSNPPEHRILIDNIENIEKLVIEK